MRNPERIGNNVLKLKRDIYHMGPHAQPDGHHRMFKNRTRLDFLVRDLLNLMVLREVELVEW